MFRPTTFFEVSVCLVGRQSKSLHICDSESPDIRHCWRELRYFKNFMDDLSAKVFRTYNASFTLQAELNRFDVKKSLTQDLGPDAEEFLLVLLHWGTPKLGTGSDSATFKMISS